LQFPSNVVTGDWLLAVGATSVNRTFSFSDDTYGSYAVDASLSSASRSIAVGSVFASSGSGTPPTVTATLGGGTGVIFLAILDFNGIVTSSPLDQTKTNTNASGTTGTTGTTLTLAQASEVAVAALLTSQASADATVAPSGYTAIPLSPVTSNGAGNFAVAYLFTSSTAAQSCTWNWSGSSAASAGIIATYKAPAVASPLLATVAVALP
jgi:hypothetical protein